MDTALLEEGRKAQAASSQFQEQVHYLDARLKELLFSYLQENGIPSDHPVYQTIPFDTIVSAMGILDYLEKLNAQVPH